MPRLVVAGWGHWGRGQVSSVHINRRQLVIAILARADGPGGSDKKASRGPYLSSVKRGPSAPKMHRLRKYQSDSHERLVFAAVLARSLSSRLALLSHYLTLRKRIFAFPTTHASPIIAEQ